jgi:hypothetical protein
MGELIAPELLAGLEAETDKVQSGKQALNEPIKRTSGLMEFVQQAFAQAFNKKFGLRISSFSQSDKEEVVVAAGDEDEVEAEMRKLVDLFVDISNVWPDVLSQSYGGSSADFLEFRTQLVPETLETLQELTAARDEPALARQLAGAKSYYDEAIRTARAGKSES